MPPAKLNILELSFYLRRLRLERWPDSKLTQSALARALGDGQPLAPATVASWENKSAPKLPPHDRVLAYAQFFATRRSLDPPEPSLVPVESFTPEERDEYDRLRTELLQLHGAAQGTSGELEVTRRSWLFPETAPVTLICPELPEKERPGMAKLGDPNYTQLLSFADLDSMVDLFGHIRAENPLSRVTFKSAPYATPDDLTGHIVIIGGIAWNSVTERILELIRLPVEQRSDPADEFGEIFVTRTDGKERKHLATWSSGELTEDVGLLARVPNPLNSNRTLTLCNGIHSRGVYGAVRSLTDEQLRESNERYIANNLPGNQFGILMRVPIIGGKAMTPDFSSPRTVLHQWSARD